jgi:sec-independent protein translocase protein TatC
MKKPHDDDLFKDSVMTFGEHLEDLRRCLFKAVIGLFVGFLIGLYFADSVVNLVQSPLVKALEEYYLETTLEEYKALHPDATSEELKLIAKQRMVLHREYIYASRVLEALREVYPKLSDVVEPSPEATKTEPASDFVQIEFWKPVAGDQRVHPQSLGMPEPFMIWLKAAFIAGLIISSPWVFYQIWSFVAAGLYPHEKKYVHVFMPFSIALFLIGAAIAFFFVFEPVLAFFLSYNKSLKIDPGPRISEWLNFVLFLPVGFGIAFQLPLVMLFLERIHVMTVTKYLKQWRVAVLVIWVLAAVLTPADPTSIFFLAVPLMFLYFGGVLLCKWWPSGRK